MTRQEWKIRNKYDVEYKKKRLKAWLKNDFCEIIFYSFLGFCYCTDLVIYCQTIIHLRRVHWFPKLPIIWYITTCICPHFAINPRKPISQINNYYSLTHWPSLYSLNVKFCNVYEMLCFPLLCLSLLHCYFPFSYNNLLVQSFQTPASSDTSQSLRGVSSGRKI